MPEVFVVMAVYNPDPGQLAAQLRSIAAQQGTGPLSLIVVPADGRSGETALHLAEQAGITRASLADTGGDLLDAVRAFEAGLAEAIARIDARPAEAGAPEPLIALSDQDDLWHAGRLARCWAEMQRADAALVHSDARLIDAAGAVTRGSMFAFERRHPRPGLRGLLYRNNVTGMTALMRADVVRLALPFPAQSGVHFYHDLWLALIAHVRPGGVRLIPEALVDYRQHEGNAIGAVDRQGGAAGSGLLARLRGIDRAWLRRESATYALARYLAHCLADRVRRRDPAALPRIAPIRAYLRMGRGAGRHLLDAAGLALRGRTGLARIAAGHALISGGRLFWSLRIALGPGLARAVQSFDRKLYALSPGLEPPLPEIAADDSRRPEALSKVIDDRKTPRWRPDFTAPRPALTLLVPSLNPSEAFAGVATALDIGTGLAARGIPVRFVATDAPISSPGASRHFLLGRLSAAERAAGAGAHISLGCGLREDRLPAHRGDVMLATAWWTAHIAHRMIRDHGFTRSRFYYLIQDYEPHFYPWGQEFADALASYDLDFDPIFNTTLLRAHFAAAGHRFATPDAPTFHPSIDIARYASGTRLPRAGPRRLAIYGRPEVPRNLYETAVEALALFIEEKGLDSSVLEPVSVGMRHRPVTLPGGLMLKSLGKLAWEDYPGFLLGTDLGLSLMYSPHPSHPPIEMAAAGVRVITNRFGQKDLSQLSPAILSARPLAEDVAAALGRAWEMGPVTEAERRIDLAPLGRPLPVVLDALAARLAPVLGGDGPGGDGGDGPGGDGGDGHG